MVRCRDAGAINPMKVRTPQQMNSAFTSASNSGGIEALLALYDPDAVLVPNPGVVVQGIPAIRAALEQFLALKGHMRSDNVYALVHGASRCSAPNGEALEIRNQTSEVVRRQRDGTWLYIVDHPYGAEPLP